MSDLSIAVTIITRNRLESLKRCLGCIAQQTYPANEVIVVDSSSGPETREFVTTYFPTIRYFHMTAPLGSQPRLRNLALQQAQSDIIAATDDDGYPQPQWLSGLIACFGPGVGAVGGRILQGIVDEGRGPDHPVVGAMTAFAGATGNFNAIWAEPFEVDHLQGTNMSFRRELLNQVNGWDLMLEGGYASYEDTETCLRIKRLGYRVMYTPHAIVQHGLSPREAGFVRDAGVSPRLAYSLSRNAVYSVFRNYELAPGIIVKAGIVAPVVNVARSLLPKQTGKSGRSLSLSPDRLRAAGAVVAGHLAGLYCVLRSRKENPWPRLRLT
jgi:GT2 family glycosyltransferase